MLQHVIQDLLWDVYFLIFYKLCVCYFVGVGLGEVFWPTKKNRVGRVGYPKDPSKVSNPTQPNLTFKIWVELGRLLAYYTFLLI